MSNPELPSESLQNDLIAADKAARRRGVRPMIKDTLKHAAIYSAASIMGKAIGFLMLPIYAHVFRGEGYGVIGMLDAAVTLMTSLFSFGIVGSTIRFYNEEQPARRSLVISTAIRLIWIGGGLLVGLGCLGSVPLARWLLGNAAMYPFVCLSFLAFLCDLSGQAASATLLIEQRSWIYSLISVGRLLLGLVLNIELIVVHDLGLWGFFIAALTTALASSLALHLLALRRCGFGFDRQIAAKIIRFELPMVPGHLVSLASGQIERIVVRATVGLEGVGLLEMGYKFPVLLPLLISEPFMRTWYPRSIEIAGEPKAGATIGNVLSLLLFLMMFAGLTLAMSADNLLHLLTPNELWGAARIMRVEVVTAILWATYTYVCFGLIYRAMTPTMSVIKTTTALIKIGMSVLLVSRWGIAGAAYSACLAATIALTWTTWRAQKVYPLRLQIGRWLVMAFVALALYMLGTIWITPQTAAVQWVQGHLVLQIEHLVTALGSHVMPLAKLAGALHERAADAAILLLKALLSCCFVVCLPLAVGGRPAALWRLIRPGVARP